MHSGRVRGSSTLIALLVVACGGEPRSPEPPPPGDPPEVRPVASRTAGEDEPTPETGATEPAPEAEAPDPFAAPLPEADCPEAPRVAIAHRSVEALPTWLEQAVAFRSEDGRHVRVAIANHPLERDDLGRFATPAAGEARFEMDATRTRRGPLEPRVLGPPHSRRGGLTHARIVGPGPILTFGHRDVGEVEITAIADDHICGRVDLDDGFGRVRGAFRAPIVGPLPE